LAVPVITFPLQAFGAICETVAGMFMFVLRVRYPMSGTIQDREFPFLDEAVRAAHAHYAAFPEGIALIRKPNSDEVVMQHHELLATYRRAKS
jgi:hypothetical protein